MSLHLAFGSLERTLGVVLDHRHRAVVAELGWFREFAAGERTLDEVAEEAEDLLVQRLNLRVERTQDEPMLVYRVLADLARKEAAVLRTLVARRARVEFPEMESLRRECGVPELLPNDRESALRVVGTLRKLADLEASAVLGPDVPVELPEMLGLLDQTRASPLTDARAAQHLDEALVELSAALVPTNFLQVARGVSLPVYRKVGVLGRLDALCRFVASAMDWSVGDALWFVFVDFDPPYAHARFEYRPSPRAIAASMGKADTQWATSRTARVVMTIDPTLSPNEVRDLYAEYRKGLVARHRQVEEKALSLAAFAASKGAVEAPEGVGWDAARKEWNAENDPSDCEPGAKPRSYEETWMFRRDCLAAVKRLLSPEFQHPGPTMGTLGSPADWIEFDDADSGD